MKSTWAARARVTLVLNARTGELLWLAEGRGKDALKGFFAKLSAEQKTSIAAVGIDRRRGGGEERGLADG